MQLLPAIDLRGGQCVRLQQGDYNRETVFSTNPADVAAKWCEQGADFLHLVDLDGAKSGTLVNQQSVADIIKRTGSKCQLGGGIRDEATIRRALDLGVSRVIIGTKAVQEPDWFADMTSKFPGQVCLGLDARDGKVATHGWLDTSELSAIDLLARFEALPIAAVIFTDISKDGMMIGPNVQATKQLADSTRHLVIASGGIGTNEHVLELARQGIRATILGRSLYEGTIRLPDLVEQLRQLSQQAGED